LPTLRFALFGLSATFAVLTRAFLMLARFKLLSVGRGASEHGDLCNEHTKDSNERSHLLFGFLPKPSTRRAPLLPKSQPQSLASNSPCQGPHLL
jgi:hypothetical protein